MTKRTFGYIRELPSGRFQASYVWPDGVRNKGPLTFKQQSSAREFLKNQEALIQLNQWEKDSDFGPTDQDTPFFGVYCERHISVQTTSRGDLLELSTQALYRNLLRTHLSPFASLRLDDITESIVNDLWPKAIKSGKKTTLSKAYKLLASVMKRAVEEKYLRARVGGPTPLIRSEPHGFAYFMGSAKQLSCWEGIRFKDHTPF